MKKSVKSLIVGATAAAVLVGGGVAFAEDPTPPPNSGGQGQQGARRGGGGPLARAVRGDLEVMAKDGVKKVHFERGKVSDVKDNSFTLTGPDGKKTTVKTDDKTRIRPKDTKLADLDTKSVMVISDAKDGDSVLAKLILAQPKGGRRRGSGQGGQGQGQQGRPPASGNPPDGGDVGL